MADSPIDNPFDEHEIIFKDKDGNLKVLRDGKIFDAKEETGGEKKADELKKTDINAQPEVIQPPALEENEFPEGSVEVEATDILKEARVDLSDEGLKKRFKNLVVSRFKGIRDIIDAREMLTKESELGGMGFSKEQSEVILKIIEERQKNRTNKENNITEELPLIQKNDDMITIEREAPAEDAKTPSGKKNEFAEARKDILKLIQEMPDYDFFPGISKGNAPKKIVITPAESLPNIVKTAEPVHAQPKYEEPKMPEGRKRQDVSLVGPLDELRILDITEFHRIDSDPVRACGRIKEKLATLEQDSFTQLTRGMAAWRQSPIYRLYVDIGRASIMKKMPIEQISGELKKAGKPYLTADEFNAIMDLNEQLRF